MELCLGTVQLGMQYGIQNNRRTNDTEAAAIITAALENGICWFDTASSYGDAEEILGNYRFHWEDGAQRMRIVSKLAPDALENAPCGRWRDIVLEHIHGTLKRIHKQQLDVYMFHNASCIFNPKAVEALDAVRHEGLAHTIGVSIYTPEEALKALEYPSIGAIQIPYNVFDRRLDQCGFFAEARRRRIKIYARSSLLQGLATMEVDRLPEHMKFSASYLAQFHSVCKEAGLSPLQAAIGFVMSHPDIQYLVFGTDSQRQLLEYIAVAAKPIPAKILQELNDMFHTAEEKLVNPSLWKEEL